MNIALVILHANPALGGAEGYTINLARSLIGRGHDVSLVATSFGSNLPHAAKQVHIPSRGVTRLRKYLGFLDDLEAHLDANPYDIVHAMLPVRRCDFYHPHAGLAFEGVERGYLRHNDPIRRTASRWATRFNRKRQRFADIEREMITGQAGPIVLCLTDRMRQAAAARFPQQQGNFVRLFYGIDLDRFDPAVKPDGGQETRARFNIAPDKVVALIVAQDFHRKGVPEAIETIARVNDPRPVLLVVGRDRQPPMRALASKMNVSGRVIFAGPTNDVYPFFKAADFMLFPARVDPCPLVVLESVAMGVPAIVTRQAGSHEIIATGRNGFVIDQPTDVPAMTDAARRLLDPETRSRMSAACTEVRPTLSQEIHVDRLLDLYARRKAAS
jgi:UDP-glucose:(heptosyl)LPS alpha-1,3-glucosyltransferase